MVRAALPPGNGLAAARGEPAGPPDLAAVLDRPGPRYLRRDLRAPQAQAPEGALRDPVAGDGVDAARPRAVERPAHKILTRGRHLLPALRPVCRGLRICPRDAGARVSYDLPPV